MDQEEKRRLLVALRTAIRAGCDRRRNDLANVREEIREELSCYRGKGALEHEQRIAGLLNAASARRFLSHTNVEGSDGKERSVEVAEAKLGEKYEKRPSVRASKKSRQNGTGFSL